MESIIKNLTNEELSVIRELLSKAIDSSKSIDDVYVQIVKEVCDRKKS